jgi:chitin synthase
MDDQARRQPKKTDHTMVDAFSKRWGNHSSFKAGAIDRSGYPSFTVNHFNGPVTYSSEGFLDRDLDAINPDFVSLLRGAADGLEGSGSINPFVKGLFSAKAIATQAHPRNEDTIVSAQQAVKPMRAPSTRRKSTIKRMPTVREVGDIEEKEREDEENHGPSGNSSHTSPCVAGEFKAAMDTLLETIDETQPWYVFCINPNDSQLPNQLEGRSVKGQVKAVGLAEIARRSVNVFEVNMTPEEFCERYREGLQIGGIAEGDEREVIEQARTTFGLNERDLVLGLHKVYSNPFNRQYILMLFAGLPFSTRVS